MLKLRPLLNWIAGMRSRIGLTPCGFKTFEVG